LCIYFFGKYTNLLFTQANVLRLFTVKGPFIDQHQNTVKICDVTHLK